MEHTTSSRRFGPAEPTVVGYRAVSRGSLEASLTVAFSTGWIVREINFFRKDSRRWIQPPTRSYKKRNGETVHEPLIEFGSPEAQDLSQAQVLAALDRYFGVEPSAGSGGETNIE